MRIILAVTTLLLLAAWPADAVQLKLTDDGAILVTAADVPPQRFEPRFTVLTAEHDPQPALRWGDWGDPSQRNQYNVMTWSTGTAKPPAKPPAKAAKKSKKPKQHVADGFDLAADRSSDAGRTSDVFAAAPATTLRASAARAVGNRIEWTFPDQPDFSLSATIELPADKTDPLLVFRFTPKTAKWFSVGYCGAPECEPAAMDEMWQPMIWQEKRFPNRPFLTESGRCPLPGTLVACQRVVTGLMADPAELPFMPMPTVANSRFGVAVRNAAGRAQSTLFAPILGGVGSKMTAGEPWVFKLRLVVRRGKITDAYESLARGLFGFRDYRRNDGLGSLNRTLERTIDYALSDWARFNDDLRGCAYDTDVPGSVKNVSALHPLGLALVTDDERIYTRRARPIMEFLLSREKFLFTIHPDVKGQGASCRLAGPCAPVSELAALYAMSGRRSPCLLEFARTFHGKTRTLNLDDAVRGDIWQNSLALYRATGDRAWLAKAKTGADIYLSQRLDTPQTNFKDPSSRGMFFWTSYAPNWMELFELYAATGQQRYLDAAQTGARRMAEFIWMCPTIPEGDVLVNLGGRAPTYRKSDKLPTIRLPEERVPAWRMSEIGLTPESSGTCKGHRGIFLATHGPWMLRLAGATGDTFLHDVGRSAIVGRSTSFPGYHMNTARTTVYEKPDFAQRPTAELNSTTSLHYNHIWPHAAMLLDYLVADAEYRSHGAITFPSQFAEGYAYVQERVYGDRPGTFYDAKDAWLWMPKGLVAFDEPEINYVAARGSDTLYLALMNQSPAAVSATLRLDAKLVEFDPARKCTARVWQENKPATPRAIDPAGFRVEIAPQGITALAISGVAMKPRFQNKLVGASEPWKKDVATLDVGGARAMLLNFGPELKSVYVYLSGGPGEFKQATLHYSTGGPWEQVSDKAFPFEFTVPLPGDATKFQFRIEATTTKGKPVSATGELAK